MGSSNPVQTVKNTAVKAREQLQDATPDRVENIAKTAAPFVIPGVANASGLTKGATTLSYLSARGAQERSRGGSVMDPTKETIQDGVQTAMDVSGSDLGLVPDVPPDPTAPIDDSTKTPGGRRKRTLDNRAGTILTGGGGTSGTLGDASGGKRSNLLGL